LPDTNALDMHGHGIHHEIRPNIVRAASTFVWVVLESAGSRSLMDAAVVLSPSAIGAGALTDNLRHTLFLATSTLCYYASRRVIDEQPRSPGVNGIGTVQVVHLARRLISAIQRASPRELSEAHAYFLAPPWHHVVAEYQPTLTDLGVGITRFMIDCALQCADERLPMSSNKGGGL
jgi:hypothetical protein